MTWEQIIGLSLTLLVMLIGLVGCMLPGMPGTPLVLVAAVAHRLYFGAASANDTVLIILTALTILAQLFDFFAGMLGAKKLGATRRGVWGAILGGMAGIFFGLPGIIIGPFVGAVLFEMLGGREFKKSAKAGAGTLLGLLLGVMGKFTICVVMIALFATDVIIRSVN